MSNAVGATSLMKVREDHIRDHLAQLFVSGFFCEEFNYRHNMLDLVWDVLELKTGTDPEDDSEKSLYVARVAVWEAKFKADARRSCADVYDRFGPDGRTIRDVVYRR